MKQLVHNIFVLIFLICCSAFTVLHAQAGIFNPKDTVLNYDSTHPPIKPATNMVGKWVRTPRVSWNTTAFKCYIYNNMAFRLKYPKNYDSTKAYPILIFFHGKGEYGTIYDNEYQLYHGGLQHGNAVDDGRFNGFLLYPQNISEFWSTGNLTNINNLLEKVMIPQGRVDPFRVYIDGLSAGGTTAWNFLSKYTKLVAAATPISSASSSLFDSAQKYKFTPVFHFQGGLDTDPTPSSARALGSKILAIGSNYKYLEFPNRGHDCWYLAWADTGYYPFYARAYKSNPWSLYGRTQFCQGEVFRDTIGVTAGFDGYEWRKNGMLITGATSNYIVATDYGTYDCRIKKGTTWSSWSPIPVVISVKPLTTQPAITITGMASNVIPAPDGSTTVPLQVPDGYATYTWQKEGSTTTLSTTRFLKAATPGLYKVQVTEKNGCGVVKTVTTVPASATRVQAETYAAMSGVQKENTLDVGGGQDVGYIDADDWIDYSVNAPTTGNYAVKFRLSSGATGAQFQVRNPSGLALATITVPNTGGWQKFVDVSATLSLRAGLQTLRLYSIAVPRWNINYFDLTNPAGPSGTADGFSQSFPVVNAGGTNGPSAASNPVATAFSKTGLQLSWSQNATPAFNETGFEIYEATAAGGPYVFKGITMADATGTTIGNLPTNATFYYKIRAVNNNAAAAVTNAVFATTLADKTPPTTPASLQVVTITKYSVDLLWTTATDDMGVAFYDVYINNQRTFVVAGNLLKTSVYNLLPNTDYTFAIKARDAAGNNSAFSNSVAAHTLTGTIKSDPSMSPANPLNYSVYINMNVDNPAPSPWANTNSLPAEGYVFKNFKNYAGNYSGTSMTLVTNFSGYNPGGMNTGNNSGVYPDNVLRSAHYCDKGIVAKVQIGGLSLNHKYSFIFLGSRSGTGDRTAIYQIGTRQVSLNASNNTTQTVQIDNVLPDQNGMVIFTVSLSPTALYAYLNALVIKAYSVSSTTPTAANRTTVAVAPVAETDVVTTVRAYPNPAQNQVMLEVPLDKPVAALTVRITDATGAVVSSRIFNGVPAGHWQQPLTLNGKASQPGVYFIHLTGLPDAKTKVLKIVKVK